VTDLQAILLMAVAALVLWAYLELCARVAE
jgi:hypothetical protein